MRFVSATFTMACALVVASCDTPTDTHTHTPADPELVEVTTPAVTAPGRWSVETIESGGDYACALEADGDAYCWGSNDGGQLGDGTTTNRNVPTAVLGGHEFVEIDARGHTCALTAEGRAYCWGHNRDGQIGDGTATNRSVPTRVSGGHVFTTITTGPGFTCALDESGTAWCWGLGDEGQLGNGTTSSSVPIPVSGSRSFASIQAGDSQDTCALEADGRGWCWGIESDVIYTPVAVGGAVRYETLAPRGSGICGLGTDDVMYCGGGMGTSVEPSRIWGDRTWIAMGDNSRLCALDAAGDIHCGGNPNLVFEGDFAGFSGGVSITSVFPEGNNPHHELCALDRDGFAFCRGDNDWGQLGNGTTTGSAELTPVFPPARSGAPGIVADLRIVSRTAASVTLTWTQVDDGTGSPAWYRMKYATPPITWSRATVGCTPTMRGNAIGATMSCTVQQLAADTEYDFQLAAFRSVNGAWVASTYSGMVRGSTGATTVDDLRVVERSDGVTSFQWTEVDDGTGQPARYRLKHARTMTSWSSASLVCNRTGIAIGARMTCQLTSESFYEPGETFDVQLMSYRLVNGAWQSSRFSNLVVVPTE